MNLEVYAICNRTEENDQKYMSYDCIESGVSHDVYLDVILIPSTIIFVEEWNKWYFVQNMTSDVAATEIYYTSYQIGSGIQCPSIGPSSMDGVGGFQNGWDTQCLEYYIPSVNTLNSTNNSSGSTRKSVFINISLVVISSYLNRLGIS